MRREPSLRQLPHSDQGALYNTVSQWGAKRWIIIGTWVSCCMLLVVLLVTEVQSLPVVYTPAVKNAPGSAKVTSYVTGSSAAGMQKDQQRPEAVHTGVEATATYGTDAIDVNSLWDALSFTPVIENLTESSGYDHEPQDDLQQLAAQNSMGSSGLASLQQYMLTPLQQPPMMNAEHDDIAVMASMVGEAIAAEVTPEEARLGYKKAFETTPPPANTTWHIGNSKVSLWQQKQHKGVQYAEDGSDGGSSSSNGSGRRSMKGSGSSSSSSSTPVIPGKGTITSSSSSSSAQAAGREEQRSLQAVAAAERLMRYALRLLKDTNRIAACGTEDDSLPPLQPEVAGGPPGGKVLLAAALQQAEAAMPNFVLQTVQFALQLAPGALFVSVYEGGSSDQTVFWLDMLRLLLLPLRAPADITTGGSLDKGQYKSHVEYQAAVRNLVIDSFFPAAGTAHCPGGSANDEPQEPATSSSGMLGAEQAQPQYSTVTPQQQDRIHLPGQQQSQQQPQIPDRDQLPALHHQQQQAVQPWQLHHRKLRASQRSARSLAGLADAAAASDAADADAGVPQRADLLAAAEASALSGAVNSGVAPFTDFNRLNPTTWTGDDNVTYASSAGALLAEFGLETWSAPIEKDDGEHGSSYISSSNNSTAAAAAAGEPPAKTRVVSNTKSSSSKAGSGTAASTLSELAACFGPDWVLFIDSGVFFCKSDLQRLLMHRTADLACGWNLEMAEPAVARNSTAAEASSMAERAVESSEQQPITPAAAAATAAAMATSETLLPESSAASAVVPHQQQQHQELLQQRAEAPFSAEGASMAAIAPTDAVALAAESRGAGHWHQHSSGATGLEQAVAVEAAMVSEQAATDVSGSANTGLPVAFERPAAFSLASNGPADSVLSSQAQAEVTAAPQSTLITAGGAAAAAVAAAGVVSTFDMPAAAGDSTSAANLGRRSAGNNLLLGTAAAPAVVSVGSQQAQSITEPAGPDQEAEAMQEYPFVPAAAVVEVVPGNQAGGSAALQTAEQLPPYSRHLQVQQQQQQQQQPDVLVREVTSEAQLARRQLFQREPLSVLQQQQSKQEQGSTRDEQEGSTDREAAARVRPSNSTLMRYPFYYGGAGVGRMVTGQPFDVLPYFAAAHPPTVRRLAAGLPVQVYCCWNGLAKLRAEPFRRGLQFRANQEGECRTTETSLLCNDLHRLGFGKALVDSGVLVTHQLELSARISNAVRQAHRMPYIRRSRWLEVQGGGSPWLFSQQQLQQDTYRTLTCCDNNASSADVRGIADAGAGVDSGGRSMSVQELLSAAASGAGAGSIQQCRHFSLLQRNYTDAFLVQGRQQHQSILAAGGV